VSPRRQQLGILDTSQLGNDEYILGFIANRLAMAQVSQGSVDITVSRKTGAVWAQYKSITFEWTD
jgi:hypothetical protein